jgi:glycosyltransferase involved in cell wall biosynthesis
MCEKGNYVFLYILHEDVKQVEEYSVDGYTIRVLPVSFMFPPLVPIGSSHNFQIIEELNFEDFDVVHFHNYYFWSLILVALAKRRARWRLIGQYHGEPELQTFGKFVHRCLLGSLDRFLVSTREEAFWLEKLRVDPRKIVRIPNVGIDTDLFRKVGEKESVPHFIYAGRMTVRPRTLKEQDPWLVLDVAESLKRYVDQFKVLMVGDGPGLQDLKRYCKKMELQQNVEFLGYKPHDLLPQLYSKCLFSFVPTSTLELDPFWGGALKESLACETAVAEFNAEIENYKQAKRRFGLLLPTCPDRAAKILSAASKDTSRLVEVGVEGRKFVQKYCSWENVVEKLLEVYRNSLVGF